MTPTFPIPEPVTVWNRFFELLQVPRPSKAEGAAIDFLDRWANSLGFESRRDAAGNLVVHVPGTTGQSASPSVILQCHVDIVSVTAEGDAHGADASRGRIPTVRGDLNPADEKRLLPNASGDWINAPFTTLGADNGIGVAMMMALAESDHRPRAGQFLIHAGKAIAAMDGRFSVGIEDIKKIAIPVLRHRLSTNFQAQAEGMTNDKIILRLLKDIKEPNVPKYAGIDTK